MVLLGTIVNGIAIAIGALLGSRLNGMRKEIHETAMQGIGLVVIVIGLSMALKTEDLILVLIAIVVGGMLGSWIGLERWLNRFETWMEQRVKGESQFAAAFVTSTLVYCVGPMSILGGLDSGLRDDHQILYTKSLLDGFSAVIFSSTLGVGVLFSLVPVVVYQGGIALSADWIAQLLDEKALDLMIQQVTAVGGLMIVGIGINLLKLAQIRVADLLPAIPIAAVCSFFF